MADLFRMTYLRLWLIFKNTFYAVSAEVKIMYWMGNIHPSQHSLQRMFRNDNFQEECKTFELQTVTYGTVRAP